jgi:hypothetical protein
MIDCGVSHDRATQSGVAVVNAALELRARERAAHLDLACAGDAALRRQVDALIQGPEQASGFLKAPPAGLGLKSVNSSLA